MKVVIWHTLKASAINKILQEEVLHQNVDVLTTVAAREAQEAPTQPEPYKVSSTRVQPRKTAKIGRPGYKVTKQKDPETGQHSLLFQLYFPDISEGVQPRHRVMSAFEQRVEPRDDKFQYVNSVRYH